MATPSRVDNTELLSNVINTTVMAGNNHWFGTDSGVTVFTGFEWITSKIQQAVLKFDVLALAVSPDTLVYCGTEGAGVARLKLSGRDLITGASTIERPWAPVPIDSVFAIHIGADGYQWFGTGHGLFRHQGINSKQNWHGFTVADGLPHRQVQAITEDAAGKIWLGTQAGVTCLSKDFSDFVNYSANDGLAHPDVRDIAIAAEGEIWFATAGGVSRFSPKANSVSFTPINTLPDAGKISVYPNPFNSSTVIEFYISQPGNVELAVYNVLGQPVCELWHGPAAPGTHSVRWNGVDASGLSVTSGLYLARLFSNATVDFQKMLVVK
jgi:ligand-binding sensor domain-containing protein